MHYLDLDLEEKELDKAGLKMPLEQLRTMRSVFGDGDRLKGVRGYAGQLRLCTVSANSSVDHVEILASHIPEDPHPVYVWPYVDMGKNERLYSLPPYFRVGRSVEAGFGYRPEPDWDLPMRAAAISDLVIGKVRSFLQRHPPVPYSESTA